MQNMHMEYHNYKTIIIIACSVSHPITSYITFYNHVKPYQCNMRSPLLYFEQTKHLDTMGTEIEVKLKIHFRNQC